MTNDDKTGLDLDFEVISQKPIWILAKLPTGETYRIRASIMVEAVRAKLVDGNISFDMDMQWRTKWEKESG